MAKRSPVPVVDGEHKHKKRKKGAEPTAGVPDQAEANGGKEGQQDKKLSDEPAQLVGLQVYWHLASADASLRQAAAAALVQELQDQQAAFTGEGGSGDETDLLQGCSAGVQYALRRLVRGLASSRGGARQGFALALGAVMANLDCVRMGALPLLVERHLELSGGLKGQDASDVLLGRVFAYGALVRSRVLSREAQRGGEAAAEAERIAQDVTEALLDLAQRKVFLREPAVAVLLDLASQLPPSILEQSLGASPLLASWLKTRPEEASPECLLLALRLGPHLPEALRQDCALLPPSRRAKDLFSRPHLERLVPALKEASHSHPRIHAVWPALLELLLPDPAKSATAALQPNGPAADAPQKTKKKAKKGGRAGAEPADSMPGPEQVAVFWSTVVDAGLLLSSHERRHLALELLLLLLPRLPLQQAPAVVSGPLVRCLQDALRDKAALLHRSAKRCLARLEEWAQETSAARVALLAALQQHSRGRFDALTRTGAVARLAEGLDLAGAQAYLALLRRTFLDGAPSDASADGGGVPEEGPAVERRRLAVEHLCALCRHPKLSASDRAAVQREVLRFLLVLASCQLPTGATTCKWLPEELRGGLAVPLADATRSLCKARFLAVLGNALPGGGGKAQPVRGNGEAGDSASGSSPQGAVELVGELASLAARSLKSTACPPAQPLSEDSKAALGSLHSSLKGLLAAGQAEPGSAGGRARALCLLQGCVLLQALLEAGPPYEEAALELAALTQRVVPANLTEVGAGPNANGAKKGGEEEDAEEDEDGKAVGDGEAGAVPAAMDVLLDVLLSLLAQPSPPIRSAAQRCFTEFCSELTPTAMEDLLRVICRAQGKGGRRRKGEGDSEEEEEEEEGSDEDGSDTDDEGQSDGDEEEGSSDSEDDSTVADGSAGLDKALRKVQEEKADKEEEEEEAMDDEAMFRIDRLLAERLQLGRGADAGKALQTEKEHFRLRALSLLDVFLRRCPTSPLTLQVLPPLLQALAVASAPPPSPAVSSSMEGLLRRRFCRGHSEVPRGAEVREAEVRELLQRVLEAASRAPNRQVAAVAAASSLWVLKVLHAACPSLEAPPDSAVGSLFSAALDAVFSKRSHVPLPFFTDAALRFPWLVAGLLPRVLHHCAAGRSEFLRAEAFHLLHQLLQRRPAPPGLGAALRPHLPALEELLRSTPGAAFMKVARRAAVLRGCTAALAALPALYPGEPATQLLDLQSVEASVRTAQGQQGPGGSKVAALLQRLQTQVQMLAAAQEAPSSGRISGSKVAQGKPGGSSPKDKAKKRGREASEKPPAARLASPKPPSKKKVQGKEKRGKGGEAT